MDGFEVGGIQSDVPEPAFLLGVMTWYPLRSQPSYISPTTPDAVQSTNTTFGTAESTSAVSIWSQSSACFFPAQSCDTEEVCESECE